ncbi:MAG: adenosylcobinamide-phosphate synthase CbiB [Gammaproteobacteria bacterium]|nr:adenosylcobinamide-phosphate synthase CbiB [Gammaproteobacteria bacterium]
MAESALILIISLLLDQLLGEPRRFHPLVGFGWCAHRLESLLNRETQTFPRLAGLFALLILTLPLIVSLHLLAGYLSYDGLLEVVVLYLAIGHKSLVEHARAVLKPLEQGKLQTARTHLSYIVSRDVQCLQQQAVITATIETVIENSNDAVFAAIFWYLIAGAPGVLCYRLVNTLDAMWGYKNKRFLGFGWAAAKFDDVLNWIPARLTVITFAFFGCFNKVLRTAFAQGALCSSPNAGPVMAAGASSLNIRLGGAAYYQQKLIAKPILGYGNMPDVSDINRAITLINKSLLLWIGVISFVAIISQVL